MSLFDYINPVNIFSGKNPLSPVAQVQGVVNAVKKPRETFAYMEDRFKHPSSADVASFFAGAGQGLRTATAEGQAEANANQRDYGAMSNEDLYRMASETSRPGDNPFEAQNYGKFTDVYAGRHSPRVYSTDNSFVFPTTEPTHPNTALVPATGAPMVVGGAAQAGAAPVGAEVTASTATPGVKSLQAPETVAKAFQIPNRLRQPSARVVR